VTSEATAPQLSEQTKRTTLTTFCVGALVGARVGCTGAIVGATGAGVGATGAGVGGTGAGVGATGAGVATTGAIVGDLPPFFFLSFFLFLADFPPFLLPFFRLLDTFVSASTWEVVAVVRLAIKTAANAEARNNILYVFGFVL